MERHATRVMQQRECGLGPCDASLRRRRKRGQRNSNSGLYGREDNTRKMFYHSRVDQVGMEAVQVVSPSNNGLRAMAYTLVRDQETKGHSRITARLGQSAASSDPRRQRWKRCNHEQKKRGVSPRGHSDM